MGAGLVTFLGSSQVECQVERVAGSRSADLHLDIPSGRQGLGHSSELLCWRLWGCPERNARLRVLLGVRLSTFSGPSRAERKVKIVAGSRFVDFLGAAPSGSKVYYVPGSAFEDLDMLSERWM